METFLYSYLKRFVLDLDETLSFGAQSMIVQFAMPPCHMPSVSACATMPPAPGIAAQMKICGFAKVQPLILPCYSERLRQT